MIMNQEGLKSIHCRRKQRSLTDNRKARGNEYKNLTKNLIIDRPFQVLSSDIVYIRTKEGFDYLCQVRDVHTNTVLAENQSETMKKDLVLQTVEMAKKRWRLPQDTIFHSDRASQYTAKEVALFISSYGWKQSFSRVGMLGDNSWSESFFSILKKEIIHLHRSFLQPSKSPEKTGISQPCSVSQSLPGSVLHLSSLTFCPLNR